MALAQQLLIPGRGRAPAAAAFSPLDLSPSLWLDAGLSQKWQDSARTVPVTSDGDPVGAWDDMSGSGRHAVQATAAKRATYKVAIQNGLPVIRFDGVDDWLRATGLPTGAAKAVYLVLVKRSAPSAPALSMVTWSMASLAALIVHSVHGTDWNYYAAPGVNSLGGNAVDWAQLDFQFASAAAMTPYRNGAAQTPGDPDDSYSTATQADLGVDALGNNATDVDLAAVLHFEAAHTAPQQTLLRNYLKARWGTP
jgi:hypothetical protein